MPEIIHRYVAKPVSIEVKEEIPDLTESKINEILNSGEVFLNIKMSLRLAPGKLLISFTPVYDPFGYTIQTSPGEVYQDGSCFKFFSRNATYTFSIIRDIKIKNSEMNQ